ncbi:transposase [Siminovitchia sp. 179-K 8D1 HS]
MRAIQILRSEIHIINKKHRLFNYCDEVCLHSKNLYNHANYLMRKLFISEGRALSAFDLNKILKDEEVFKALPAKTSQQIIIALGRNWKSFFISIKDWSKNKSKYTGKPRLPRYKKKDGRNIVFYDYQQGTLKDGKYKFPKTDYFIETSVTKDMFRQVQIIPYGSCYKIAVVYRKELEIKKNINSSYLSIDLGIDNLATLTNNIGKQSIVINGRILKSINQYYNKKLAKLRSYVGRRTSNRIKKLNIKRNNIVETQFHKISRHIINYCLKNDIDNIAIGRNKDWQRNSKMSRKTNQKFVQIPFEKLIDQLKYKGEECGIKVIVIEEQYTSAASFIDNDFLPFKFGNYEFSGRRVKRGLYKSKNGTLINADVNGSYNILRKCNPEFSYDRIEGVSLHPVRINIA